MAGYPDKCNAKRMVDFVERTTDTCIVTVTGKRSVLWP